MFTIDGSTSSTSVSRSNAFPGQLELHMVVTGETYEALERLSEFAKTDIGDILVRGVALLLVATKAQEEGKQLGIGREGGPLETVIDVF